MPAPRTHTAKPQLTETDPAPYVDAETIRAPKLAPYVDAEPAEVDELAPYAEPAEVDEA